MSIILRETVYNHDLRIKKAINKLQRISGDADEENVASVSVSVTVCDAFLCL